MLSGGPSNMGGSCTLWHVISLEMHKNRDRNKKQVFEIVYLASQLHSYFEDCQLLIISIYQGAWHHGKSTEQLLLVAVDTIVCSLDMLSWTYGRLLTF